MFLIVLKIDYEPSSPYGFISLPIVVIHEEYKRFTNSFSLYFSIFVSDFLFISQYSFVNFTLNLRRHKRVSNCCFSMKKYTIVIFNYISIFIFRFYLSFLWLCSFIFIFPLYFVIFYILLFQIDYFYLVNFTLNSGI